MADDFASGFGILGDFVSVGKNEDGDSVDEDGNTESDFRESYGSWEKLDKTREDILEEYGKIYTV